MEDENFSAGDILGGSIDPSNAVDNYEEFSNFLVNIERIYSVPFALFSLFTHRLVFATKFQEGQFVEDENFSVDDILRGSINPSNTVGSSHEW